MANQKTRKVLDIRAEGKHLVCIKDIEKDVYRLYRMYRGVNRYGYPTEKRELISEMDLFESVLLYIGHTWNKI